MLRVNNLRGFGVQQGLVWPGLSLYLDAGNPNSYPGSGSTWTDLSGAGRNGTLTNGPTFDSADGGSIVFDGVNDYVAGSGSITTAEATFIVWLKRNGTQTAFHGILFTRSASGNTTGVNIGPSSTSNQLGYSWNDTPSSFNWNSGLIIPNLEWCMCVVAVSSSAATAYLYQSSGLGTATNTISHTTTVMNPTPDVGRDPFDSRNISGNIAQALIYNRALTEAEISQIFKATRRRYGI